MRTKTQAAQKRHVHEIRYIERESYPHEFLTEIQLDKILERMNSDGYVIIDSMDHVLAYVLYDNNEDHIEILRLAVHPLRRKCGYGKMLLNKVKTKLTSNKNKILIHVPDHMVDGHKFLRSQGLIASKVDYRHYRKHHTDSYLFVYLRDWDHVEAEEYIQEEENVIPSGV